MTPEPLDPNLHAKISLKYLKKITAYQFSLGFLCSVSLNISHQLWDPFQIFPAILGLLRYVASLLSKLYLLLASGKSLIIKPGQLPHCLPASFPTAYLPNMSTLPHLHSPAITLPSTKLPQARLIYLFHLPLYGYLHTLHFGMHKPTPLVILCVLTA